MAVVHHQRAATVPQNVVGGNQSMTEVLEYFNYAGTLDYITRQPLYHLKHLNLPNMRKMATTCDQKILF